MKYYKYPQNLRGEVGLLFSLMKRLKSRGNKRIFNNNEDKIWEELEDMGMEEIFETKIEKRDKKVPIYILTKTKNTNYQYEEKNADIKVEKEQEEIEESP